MMNSLGRSLSLVVLLASQAYGASGGTVSGVVKDATGAPLKGAFVRARNETSKITTSVLSDRQGRYQFQNLPPGDYQIQAAAIGYQREPRSGVKVDAAQRTMKRTMKRDFPDVGNVAVVGYKPDYDISAGMWYADVVFERAPRYGTLDILLEMLDRAVRDGGVTVDQIRERRFYFDHGVTIRPDQIPLLKKYGITVTFQGVNFDQGPEIERDYGAQYLKWLMPAKTMLDAGVRFVVSSDVHMAETPSEFRLSGLSWHGIWSSLEALITREVDGRVWEPDERLDRVTTLRGITTWSAWLMLREKDLGSLETGKLADFTIIDKDYFTIPEREIHTIQSLLTVVGGKTIYRSPGW